MAPHGQADRSGVGRLLLCLGVQMAALLVFFGSSGAAAEGGAASVGSPICFFDRDPGNEPPPAPVAHPLALLESELVPEGEVELEDGGEYSWPSISDLSADTTDRVIASSHAEGVHGPWFFVDAADLSRFCRLTL